MLNTICLMFQDKAVRNDHMVINRVRFPYGGRQVSEIIRIFNFTSKVLPL